MLQTVSFDQARIELVQRFAGGNVSGNLPADQLALILRDFSFDQDRNLAAEYLVRFLPPTITPKDAQRIVAAFSFDEGKTRIGNALASRAESSRAFRADITNR